MIPEGFTSVYAPVAVVILIWMIVSFVRWLLWPSKRESRQKKLHSKPWRRDRL